MITVFAHILMEETHNGRVRVVMDARHSGVHATKAELRAVHTFIEAMQATSALSIEMHKPTEKLALPNGAKKKTKRRRKHGNTVS